ncbi:MAG: PilN domain-containing protein [Bacteroidales bacterium]
MNSTLNILDPKTKTINLWVYQFDMYEGKITSCLSIISNREESISLGEEKISNYGVLAFSAGLSTCLNNFRSHNHAITTITNINEEFKAFRLMKIVGAGLLATFFLVLLFNYFVFDYYNSNYNSLTSRLTEYQGFLTNYEIQKNDLEAKKALLTETGLLEPTKISYYADRIAASLPKDINLKSFEINPKVSKKNDPKTIGFVKGKITIEGYASKGSIINNWMKTIEEYDWVERISKITINSENESNNRVAGFTLDIEIK